MTTNHSANYNVDIELGAVLLNSINPNTETSKCINKHEKEFLELSEYYICSNISKLAAEHINEIYNNIKSLYRLSNVINVLIDKKYNQYNVNVDSTINIFMIQFMDTINNSIKIFIKLRQIMIANTTSKNLIMFHINIFHEKLNGLINKNSNYSYSNDLNNLINNLIQCINITRYHYENINTIDFKF